MILDLAHVQARGTAPRTRPVRLATSRTACHFCCVLELALRFHVYASLSEMLQGLLEGDISTIVAHIPQWASALLAHVRFGLQDGLGGRL